MPPGRVAGCAGLCPKLRILRAARQTHLTALRLTQNKATSKLSSSIVRERARDSQTARQGQQLCGYMTQHPAAFPQQAAQQNGSAKITYTSYYAYAAWQVEPAVTYCIFAAKLLMKCSLPPLPTTSVINVSLLPQSTTKFNYNFVLLSNFSHS